MSPVDIAMAVVALCLVIILHEFGHYITAVASGMKVERFSVFGIGPAIVRLGHYRGTEFVISAIPFGAYVLIRGMEPQPDDAEAGRDEEDNFRDKPLSRRALVIAGGPVANYITAILLFFVVFAVFGPKAPPQAIVIDGFAETSAAFAAGLAEGDELVRIGGQDIDPQQRAKDVVAASEPFRGKAMPVVVRRDGALVHAEVQVPTEGFALGIETREVAPRERVGLGVAVRDAVAAPFITTVNQLRAFRLLFTGAAGLSGPVKIVEEIAKSAQRGLADFIEFTALISTLLGMFNLLPIPALDGGRLVFLGYEAIRGRPARPRVEEMVHGIGIYVLLGLLAVVTFGDVRKLGCSVEAPAPAPPAERNT